MAKQIPTDTYAAITLQTEKIATLARAISSQATGDESVLADVIVDLVQVVNAKAAAACGLDGGTGRS